ncbi:MAG: hypothetical protein PF795_11155 [Kiritimatiellae bacterium]|jgi:hypothetical protein|nr:hypothetical protein [Kiritimatiellia bacterium]
MNATQIDNLTWIARLARWIVAGALMTAVAHGQAPLSHYSLDGTLTDSGSLGIDGELIGSAGFTTTDEGVGDFGEALSTSDGTQDFFRAATANNAAFGMDALTISLWVNVSERSSVVEDRLVSNLTSSNGFDLHLRHNNLTEGDYRLGFGINSTSGFS